MKMIAECFITFLVVVCFLPVAIFFTCMDKTIRCNKMSWDVYFYNDYYDFKGVEA